MDDLPVGLFILGHFICFKWMTDDIEDDLGAYISDRRCIFIRKNQKQSIAVSTAIHEILHAVFDLMNLKDESKEEDTVSCYEIAIVSILTDPRNKEFLTWARKNI